MSLMSAIARIEAAESGIAQPIAGLRHRHLSDRPLVLIPLMLTGEAATPLAIALGTSRADRHVLVVPQPRNPELRYEVIARLGAIVIDYIDRHASDRCTRAAKNGREHSWYPDAPQLIVPNPGGITALAHLGRMTRFRQTTGEHAVDPLVPRLGSWLTFLADRAEHAGSALLTAATDLLCEQWATGQSPEEDSNLHTVLAWVHPPPGETGLQAALRAEDPLLVPPAGPATDPSFDNALLEPAIAAYDAAHKTEDPDAQLRAVEHITEVLVTQLNPTWEAMWNAIALLRAVPAAPSNTARWLSDCEAFTDYSDHLAAGGLPQPRRDSPRAAGERLARLEQTQAGYDARRALEDPYIFAERQCEGEAFTGTVVDTEPDHTEPSESGKTLVLRPRFTMTTTDPVRLKEGTKLASPGRPGGHRVQIKDLVTHGATTTVLLEVTSGMGTVKRPTPGAAPALESRQSYTLAPDYRPTATFPAADQTPWTHRSTTATPDTPPETADDD